MNSQNVKTKTNKTANVKMIALTAMFAALVTVFTAFIKIPSPFGYAHAGDSMIYLAASVLPGPYGALASSIGASLADLLSGYAQWCLPTFIIKAFNALPFVICSMILKKRGKDEKIINIPNLLMIIPSTIVTVGGYFIANGLMYGWAAAVGELATWWLQPLMAAVIYILAGVALDSAKFKSKLMPRLMM